MTKPWRWQRGGYDKLRISDSPAGPPPATRPPETGARRRTPGLCGLVAVTLVQMRTFSATGPSGDHDDGQQQGQERGTVAPTQDLVASGKGSKGGGAFSRTDGCGAQRPCVASIVTLQIAVFALACKALRAALLTLLHISRYHIHEVIAERRSGADQMIHPGTQLRKALS